MKIRSKVATTIGLAFVAAGSMALPASAKSASPDSSVTTTAVDQSSTTADRPCGGPYKVGDDAVWYSCNDSSEQICVRQYAPYRNYTVWVEPWGEHHNSWRWTIDMSKDMSHC